jgi:glycosyltransferase
LRTVESVRDLEICEHIIINGGSCPQTSEFIQGYSGKTVSEPDLGISDAFNKGIRYSQGEALIMLNSGDILIDRTYPKKSIKILHEHPEIDFVHADLIFEDKLIGPYIMRPLRTQNKLHPNIGRGMPYRHQSMVVRNSIYDKVGLFNLNYICSDYDWVSRWELISKKSNGIAYYLQGDPVIKMDGAGISSTKEEKIIREAIQIIGIRSKECSFIQNIVSYYALLIRVVLFYGRTILKRYGLEKFLIKLKHTKYKKYLVIN